MLPAWLQNIVGGISNTFSDPGYSQEMKDLISPVAKKRELKQQEVGSMKLASAPEGMGYGQMANTSPVNYSDRAGFIPVPDNFSPSDPSQFARVAKPLAESYGVPMEIAMGQKFAENRGEPINRNNFYNLGAVDSSPESGMDYESPVQGMEDYFRFITGEADVSFYGNGAKGKSAYKDAFNRYQQTGDKEQFLEDIQNAGYAGDPNTYADRADNGYSSYSEFIKNVPEWRNKY